MIYKWQSALPENAVWTRRLGHLINGLFGALVNNYSCIGFLVRLITSYSLNAVKIFQADAHNSYSYDAFECAIKVHFMDMPSIMSMFSAYGNLGSVLTCSCFSEQLLSYRETLQAYSSVHYVGTVVPIAIILFGIVMPPRAGSARKIKKVQ